MNNRPFCVSFTAEIGSWHRTAAHGAESWPQANPSAAKCTISRCSGAAWSTSACC